MKKKDLYTSGEFAAKAQVTLRTIRYYDKQNILKPSERSESGARYYTDADFAALQQILLWKYLGFSLDEIREMTLASTEKQALLGSLQIQKKLVEERISEMKDVAESIDHLSEEIASDHPVDWSGMMRLIHMTSMERSLKEQYQSAANISARIRLHRDYSVNAEGWFRWVFEQCEISDAGGAAGEVGAGGKAGAGDIAGGQADASGLRILEVGCGNGALWLENADRIPAGAEIVLSDISEGMIHDARRELTQERVRVGDGGETAFSGEAAEMTFEVFDCSHIPFADNTFDRVIAGHVFFYCRDVKRAIEECVRVLKPGGLLICSTYGRRHMREITDLVQEFNPEIALAAEQLYEKFGRENGGEILEACIGDVRWVQYEDSIEIDEPEPLIAYVLSCHGNQNRLLIDHFKEFREFVGQKVAGGFHITKDAGAFVCRKG